tara:strand:- start:4077 stop:5909 length:1833 start_codon:yes stop_codon:yes gene_type:complete
MTDEEIEAAAMAECGACRAVIPIDSTECPECGTNFSGISEDELGECGACNALVPLDSTRCPECGVLFVADDVVDILRQWVADTGINIRKLFEKFDENSDGTIDSDELKRGLLSLNLADLPPSQVDRLVAEIDADGNGVIDLDEFDQILMGETSVESDGEPDSEEPADAKDVEDDPGQSEDDSAEETEIEPASEAEDEESSEDADASDDTEDDGEEDDETAEEESEDGTDDDEESSIEDEDFDLEDDSDGQEDEGDAESAQAGRSTLAALSALADLMDEHDISAQRLFNELDADGNGVVSITELKVMIEEKYGDELDIEQVNAIMDSADADGDGTLDITEFIGSMEDYETMEELVEEKVFPSPWQKRMMSKSWNDTVWPILHVGFGLLIAIFIANGMFGFVDGSGGNIAYEPNDSGLIPSGNIAEGDIYPCDEKYQKDGCRNSLTPLAGENGSLSMPTNFYWDGIVFIILSAIGMGATLFLHLVKAPEWRARAKAMREFEEDKSDASESSEEEDQGEEDEGAGDEEDDVADDGESYDEEDDEDSEYEDEDDEGDEESDDDIDIGSHIGLVFDDEEVFGKIVEFDDDEGTVTIEEDGTGDLVTGYQEDMFIE